MEIRNPNQTHLPALHALLQRCLGGTFSPEAVADRIFYEENYDPNHVWMAREGGQMLGFLHSVFTGDAAQIKLMLVAPERRRQGMGRDLLSRAEFRLSGEGARRITLGPTPPREFFPGLEPGSVAEAFFVAQGYEPAGEVQRHWVQPTASQAAAQPDLSAALQFAQAQAPAQWAWVEDALACRPSKALYQPGVGLLLTEPGESLGPLWTEATAATDAVAALAQAGLALASSAPPSDARGLRCFSVPGSAPLPLSPALTETFVSYSKSLH